MEKKTNIQEFMDNYVGQNATPEERARANEFAKFLEHEVATDPNHSLGAILKRLKSKYEYELGITTQQKRAAQIRAVIQLLIAAITVALVAFFFA